MRTVLFYISGHGYGHAVRMSEVMRELRRLCPDWRILARTQCPRRLLPEDVEHSSAEFDSGVAERETGVVMDEEETVVRLKRLLGAWDSVVEAEIGFVSQQKVDLIVSDIPPVSGDIAHRAKLPCVGISNFTWDWIYEPYAGGLLDKLERGYSHMDVLLRLPFAQTGRLDCFRRIVEAPLIARRSRSLPPKREHGPLRALLGSRAQVAEEALARAKAESAQFEFVIPTAGADFPEVLASCDVVIAKLGFNILAESIAGRKPLLYPPRVNFREEEILQAEAGKHTAVLPIPLTDFYGGNWASHLRALMAMPPVQSHLRTDGAAFCAEFLAGS